MKIKYRVWDKGNKCYRDLSRREILTYGDGRIFRKTHDFFEDVSDKFEIELAIGLIDRNNKEAYHKDRVSARGYSNWIIEWHNNAWMLQQENRENYQPIPGGFIIIGNIHGTPELLEAK